MVGVFILNMNRLSRCNFGAIGMKQGGNNGNNRHNGRCDTLWTVLLLTVDQKVAGSTPIIALLMTKARKILRTIPLITLFILCEITLPPFVNGATVVRPE